MKRLKDLFEKLKNRKKETVQDPVFNEPIHETEEVELPLPQKGRVDLPMLLIT